MFGRNDKQSPREEQELEVDAMLERDILAVKAAVDTFLDSPGEDCRRDLVALLRRLDHQIALGDAYSNRFVGASNVGLLPRSLAVGATGNNSVSQGVRSSEFRAQVAMVRAAKAVVGAPSPRSLASLQEARDTLDALRDMAG
jgi:hypothetical protein